MIKTLLTSLLLLSVFSFSFAQQNPGTIPHHCYSDEIVNKLLLDNPQLEQIIETKEQEIKNYLDLQELNGNNTPENSLIIPVAVFVIHENGAENITDAQVISQINILNTYFDPYGLKFCLANTKGSQNLLTINSPAGITSSTPGIFHLANATLANHNVNAEAALKATGNTLSSEDYMKIWVVKSISSNSLPPNAKILGYALFPQFATPALDGIVMSYDAFGDVNTCACNTLEPYSEQGKVLVHEVGHYLGLYHTFHGGCSGMSMSTCATQGDRLCDTPPVASPNSGCPSSTHNTCNESPDLPDNISNYMDYTSEACQTDFTVGQKNRMYAHLNLYRGNLTSSGNLVYTGTTCNGGVLADFIGSNFAPCKGTSVTFSAIPATGATYAWDFGDGSAGTGQNVSHNYSSAYMPATVVLTVTNGSDSASSSKLIYVDTCPPMNSTQGHWYFSQSGGLDFSSGAPLYDNGAYLNNNYIEEVTAVQSNDQGDLLFYSDGNKLWDKNHIQVNNNSTTEILGGPHSHKGILSLKDPGNPNEYYLFTKDDVELFNGQAGQQIPGQDGYRYSKVAITGTQVAMTSTWNVPITMPSSYNYDVGNDNALIGAEGISAVKSCDGYWILSTGKKGTDYYVLIHSLTASGLAFHSETISPYPTMQQTFKFSADGSKMTLASGTTIFGTTGQNNGLTLYDFDTYSGTFSNPTTINTGGSVYGVSFSPNGKLLYMTGWSISGLYQFDLTASNPSQSGIQVATMNPGAQMQLGPNNKLYLALSSYQNIHVVHSPNTRVTATGSNECQHSPNGPQMQSNIFFGGLPNIIDADEKSVFTNTLGHQQNNCLSYSFSPSICSGTFLWDFGDVASGGNNTSTLNYPTHNFSGPGIYTVSVIANGTTLTETIEIGTQSTILGTPTICLNSNALGNYSTNLQPGQTAAWTVTGGGITGVANQSDVFVTWVNLPGTVTLTVTDNTTGCSSTSTFTVTQDCSTFGLEEFNENHFVLFPNPSQDFFILSFDEKINSQTQIALKTLDGKTISVKQFIPANNDVRIEIPESVSNGFIFVEVQINGLRSTKKIMVIK